MPTAELVSHNLNLYEIEDGLIEMIAAREEAETPEEIAAADSAIQAYVQAEIRKVDGIRGYLRQCDVMIKAAKEEAAIQKARADTWEARRDALKARCLEVMQRFGTPRLEGRTGSLAVTTNGGRLAVAIPDESLVPDEFHYVVVTLPLARYRAIEAQFHELPEVVPFISKTEIERAIAAGQGVPGAYLEERGVHLRVR